MSKIKVGEYIRTTQGYIAKIERIDNEFIECDKTIWCYYEETPMLYIIAEKEEWGTIKSITKHSFNIIDLIEVGDYVDGYEVTNFDLTYMENKDIHTIVTKEQFKESEYKVNEN